VTRRGSHVSVWEQAHQVEGRAGLGPGVRQELGLFEAQKAKDGAARLLWAGGEWHKYS
jgi:hypothetical protein